jgi:hypothetical protein
MIIQTYTHKAPPKNPKARYLLSSPCACSLLCTVPFVGRRQPPYTYPVQPVSTHKFHYPCSESRPTFPCPLEEEANYKNLQARHSNHKRHLHQTEVEYTLLGRLDGTKIAILARTEVFLVAGNS